MDDPMIWVLILILGAMLVIGLFVIAIFVKAFGVRQDVLFIQEDIQAVRHRVEDYESMAKDLEAMLAILEETEPPRPEPALDAGLDNNFRLL